MVYEFYPIKEPVFQINLDKHFKIQPVCVIIGKRYFYHDFNYNTYVEYEAPVKLDMEIL